MPDETGFPTPDEIINGLKPEKPKLEDSQAAQPIIPDGMVLALITPQMAQTIQHIPVTPEQAKAISLVISGMPYFTVAIKQEVDAEGNAINADFFTALDGDKEVLRNAAPHLDEVVQRLLHRSGII